ncbi:MAG: cupin domain-containing protein [Alphaproteobacteria bacterium]|nr:cupin domain-containing protein [Alphaproteobacteria bacterium]
MSVALYGGEQSQEEAIALLGLERHPEGGWFKEIHREEGADGGRGALTSIYYLLGLDEVSAWHRVTDATEVWCWHAGAPLALTLSPNGHDAEAHRLGPNLAQGERPQVIVPKNWWQTAESLGRWTLVGCVVAPAFSFDGFEMAPKDWRPTPRSS